MTRNKPKAQAGRDANAFQVFPYFVENEFSLLGRYHSHDSHLESRSVSGESAGASKALVNQSIVEFQAPDISRPRLAEAMSRWWRTPETRHIAPLHRPQCPVWVNNGPNRHARFTSA